MLVPVTGSSILTLRGKAVRHSTKVSRQHTNIEDAKAFLTKYGLGIPWMLNGYCTIVVSPSRRGDMITLYDIWGDNVHYAEPRLHLNRMSFDGKLTSLSPYAPQGIDQRTKPKLFDKTVRRPKPWLNRKAPFTAIQVAWEYHYGAKVNKFLNMSINGTFECITADKTTKLKSEVYHEAFMEALKI